MSTVQVRYIVKDIDAAIAFYCHLWLNDLGAAGQNRAATEFRGHLRRSLAN